MSDDEDDDEEEYGKEEHEKEAIAEEIFQDGEGEEGQEAVEAPMAPPEEEEEDDEESGMWPQAGKPGFGWLLGLPRPYEQGGKPFFSYRPPEFDRSSFPGASLLFSLATHIVGTKAMQSWLMPCL